MLAARLYEIERELIPQGLHVAGAAASRAERIDLILASAQARGEPLDQATAEALVDGTQAADTPLLKDMAALDAALSANGELDGIVHALGGGYIRPVAGGDLLRIARDPADRTQHPWLRPVPPALTPSRCRTARRRRSG